MLKNRIAGLCVAALAATLIALPASAQGGDELDGAYEFAHMDTPDGIQQTQTGMMVVNGGYLCHVRTQNEREPIANEDSAEESARKAAALFQSANATCGKFTVTGSTIQITWHSAINPASVGNTAEFTFEKTGEQLVIAPAAAPQFKFVYQRK